MQPRVSGRGMPGGREGGKRIVAERRWLGEGEEVSQSKRMMGVEGERDGEEWGGGGGW